jgi:hypothetical protein
MRTRVDDVVKEYHEGWDRFDGADVGALIEERDRLMKERDDLGRQLGEARATILEIMTELTKAGYQFMHEGEEPVIECCDCEFPLAEGHADDCNRPR